MNKNQFLGELQQILQSDQSLDLDSRLGGFATWDSLAMMTMVAYFDLHFEKEVTFPQLKQCVTVADLISLAESA